MKVYDLFLYNKEEVIDLRLKIHDNFVDYFVIVEFNKTFQNNFKSYEFDLKKYEKFKHKIIYKRKTLPNKFENQTPWEIETFQRNSLTDDLEIQDNDVIFLSDIDEIIDPKKFLIYSDSVTLYECLNFRFFGNYLNLTNPIWNRPLSINYRLAKDTTLQKLRMSHKALKKGPFYDCYRKDINNYMINVVKNAGWHFSSLKPENRSLIKTIQKKHKEYSHIEFNNSFFNNDKILTFKIYMGFDIYNGPYRWGSITNVITNPIIKEWMKSKNLLSTINEKKKFKIKKNFVYNITIRLISILNKMINIYLKLKHL
jgi:hypothetical protein